MTDEAVGWRPFLADLLISDHQTGGEPRLPPGGRGPLRAALRRLLVNRPLLDEHIRFLQQALAGRFRHSELLPAAKAERLLERGVKALDDAALAALLLNPVALYALSEEVAERLPAAWLRAMEEEGKRLLASQGRGVPAFIPPPGVAGAARERGPAPPGRRWRFEVRAGECGWWGVGGPERGRAAVEVSWQEGVGLRVGVSGFLRPGPGAALHVRWQTAAGGLRAEGRAPVGAGSFVLAGPDRAGPSAGDRLLLRCESSVAGTEGWGVGCEVKF
jgi:hypothetical protein